MIKKIKATIKIQKWWRWRKFKNMKILIHNIKTSAA